MVRRQMKKRSFLSILVIVAAACGSGTEPGTIAGVLNPDNTYRFSRNHHSVVQGSPPIVGDNTLVIGGSYPLTGSSLHLSGPTFDPSAFSLDMQVHGRQITWTQ